MAVEVAVLDDHAIVELSGWDRMMCWRSHVVFDHTHIESASASNRASLEQLIDHRTSGSGTHDGSKRPNRRRVGTMLGRGVAGKQFWAVSAGSGDTPLLVLDLQDHEFGRAVLAIQDVDQAVVAIKQSLASQTDDQEHPS